MAKFKLFMENDEKIQGIDPINASHSWMDKWGKIYTVFPTYRTHQDLAEAILRENKTPFNDAFETLMRDGWLRIVNKIHFLIAHNNIIPKTSIKKGQIEVLKKIMWANMMNKVMFDNGKSLERFLEKDAA